MKFQALPLSERIGTEIRTDVEMLLTPAVGKEVRRLLVERGVLAFRALNLDGEQQDRCAELRRPACGALPFFRHGVTEG